MLENQKFRPAQVIGPLGEPLTLDSLPPPSTTRWVVRRKAEVVAAVAGGLLTVDEACLPQSYGFCPSRIAAANAAGRRSAFRQRAVDGLLVGASTPWRVGRPITTTRVVAGIFASTARAAALIPD